MYRVIILFLLVIAGCTPRDKAGIGQLENEITTQDDAQFNQHTLSTEDMGIIWIKVWKRF